MPPRAVVLSLDQLSRRCLGCYGHEWIETPNLDRLASRGVVFDQCFSSPAPEFELRDATKSLCERLSGDGIIVQRLRESATSDTDEFSKTPFGQLVAEAEKALTKLSRDRMAPWLLWLESSGIGWPGLATSQFAELYADELDDDDVPNELMAIREIEVAYAALLTQFDHLLGGLLGTIVRLFGDAPPLIVVVAAHGQGVCEAEMLSPFADRSAELTADAGAFRDELVHVPMLVAGATTESLGSRRSELVMPNDVVATLSDWFSPTPESDAASLLPLLRNEECLGRSELFFRDTEGHAAVRTKRFMFVQPDAAAQLASARSVDEIADDATGWLFLKPEDVWEVNDVAEQNPEQVATLRAALRTWLRSNQPDAPARGL